MTRWEYLTARLYIDYDGVYTVRYDKDTEGTLNALGHNRWELITIGPWSAWTEVYHLPNPGLVDIPMMSYKGVTAHAIFKREKP